MTNEEAIFAEALGKGSASERSTYLDEACAGNADLRREVEALLRAHQRAAGILEAPRVSLGVAGVGPPSSEAVGSTVGPYKLLEQIGGGGMGVVYMAEQLHPVRRKVALKIIKPGMDSGQVIARFEAERQALTMMEHPNIAKVLDAGTTDTGRPYFVMELVKGMPITDYCDQARLTTRERLELFMQVCHAVQHAHHKGVIHRDLKPGNVLVTLHDDKPVPKVIDFGIAKAAGPVLTERTLFTNYAQMLGTPLYMSPEQAQISGLDVDTRSDVYSLGVLLYELLTGTTPFEKERLHDAAYDEMRRIIREEDPPNPSTRLSTMGAKLTAISAHRHTDSKKLGQLVRGELDWIVMKSLEKDRSRRYETANGLAMDVQRHLSDERVLACPPRKLYMLRKLIRRNRLAFVASGAVIGALIIGLGLSTWQFLRERQTRQRAVAAEIVAKTEAIKSEQVARFLQDMLKDVAPSVALGRDMTMRREILKQTAERLNDLKAQPAVEADLRATLGNVYADLGQFAIAEDMLRQALAIRKKLHDQPHPEVASSLNDLAEVLRKHNKFPEAEVMHREALAMRRKLFDGEHPDLLTSLDNLAETLSRQLQRAKSAEAEPMLLEVLAARRKQFGNESLDVARSLSNLGLFRLRGTRPADGERLFREGLAIRRKLLGNDHPEVAESLHSVGDSLMRQQKPAEAEPLLREALAIRRKLFGEKHPYVGRSLTSVATSRLRQGDLTEAEALYRRALTMQWNLPVEVNPDLWDAMNGLTNCLMLQHAYPEAESLQRELLAINRRRMTRRETFGTTAVIKVASALRAQGKIAEIESLYREELALRRGLLGSDDPQVAVLVEMLAGVLGEEEKLAEAETLSRESVRIRERAGPQDDWRIPLAWSLLGEALSRQRKFEEAEPLLLRGYEDLVAHPPPRSQSARTTEALNRIVQLYERWGMSEKAAEWRLKLPPPATGPTPTPSTQP